MRHHLSLRILFQVLAFITTLPVSTGQTLEKVILDGQDFFSSYYLAVAPEEIPPAGALILLAGFGQIAESNPPETKLHNVAFANQILTVFYAAGNKLYADSITVQNLTRVVDDVIRRYQVPSERIVIGGYSAGGAIALRYAELCNQFPERFQVKPRGVFMVDSPIDIFTIYEQLENSARNNYSAIATEEAHRAIAFINNDYGIPRDNIPTYAGLTAFSMNETYGRNEIFLKETPIRAYHDVDIAWRIVNRNQTVHGSNYEVTAELINRLRLMGNDKAEFMQSFQTGYRSDGTRHPHSWSIVEEVECIQWVRRCMGL